MNVSSISILGAGKLGITLAQLALKAGYVVYLAGSGDSSKIALTAKVLTPGAIATTAGLAAKKGDVTILALPLSKYCAIPKDDLKGKLVIDAMNYWWEVDGPRDDLMKRDVSSSEVVQAFLSESRIVKALSHMGYHDLYDETKPGTALNRKAIAIAGDNQSDITLVAVIVDKLGFDPVVAGPLAHGKRFEPGNKTFGANVNAKVLREMIHIDKKPTKNR